MKARLLLALALLPLSALAQIQVFVFNGTSETPAGSFFNVGAATPGDTLETRFRVRNEGSGPAALQTLLLAGSGVSAGLSLCPFPALHHRARKLCRVSRRFHAHIDCNVFGVHDSEHHQHHAPRQRCGGGFTHAGRLANTACGGSLH